MAAPSALHHRGRRIAGRALRAVPAGGDQRAAAARRSLAPPRPWSLSRPPGSPTAHGWAWPLALRPAIARARRLIETHLADHLTIGGLAAATHLSPAYFAELFSAETGETPGQYRTRLRIERARLLLAETDMPITMIAADLGYSSSQHFATAFRRDTGTTPSRYRREVTDRTHP